VKVIGYIRVSKEEQVQSGLGLDAQRDSIVGFVKSREEFSGCSFIPSGDIERDEGVSGALPASERRGLRRAMARIGRGDVLIVSKRDRLARDAFEALLVEREFDKRGAHIVSVAGEGTEDSTPSGRLFRRIVDAFSEYERAIIAWRVKQALDQKKVRGERSGTIPFGRDLGADGKTLVPNEEEMQVLRDVWKMRGEGKRIPEIVDDLNVRGVRSKTGKLWSYAAVQRLCERKRT